MKSFILLFFCGHWVFTLIEHTLGSKVFFTNKYDLISDFYQNVFFSKCVMIVIFKKKRLRNVCVSDKLPVPGCDHCALTLYFTLLFTWWYFYSGRSDILLIWPCLLVSRGTPHLSIASVIWVDRWGRPSSQLHMCGLTCSLVSSGDAAKV